MMTNPDNFPLHPNDNRHVADWTWNSSPGGYLNPEEKEPYLFAYKVYDLVKNGAHKKLKTYVDEGKLNINTPHLPKTLALAGVHKNGSQVLRVLHEAGFDLYAANTYFDTVWKLAIERELLPIVDTLIDLKISPNIQNKVSSTEHFYHGCQFESPLMTCFLKNNADLFLKVLSMGLPPNEAGEFLNKKVPDVFCWMIKQVRKKQNLTIVNKMIPILFEKNYFPVNDGGIYHFVFFNSNIRSYDKKSLQLIQTLSENGVIWDPLILKQMKENLAWRGVSDTLQSSADLAQSIHLKDKLLKELPESNKNDKKMRL